MKKAIMILAGTILLSGIFAGCTNSGTQTAGTQTPNTSATATEETQPSKTQAQETQQDLGYAFEFEDVDGNMHKLSDYQGKPVYLRVWGSWCSVCMATLKEFNTFAGEPHDYEVISVVFPGVYGEKSKADFIPWFKELEYNNLTVLLDEDSQLIHDFGISAFPSQIMFDANGNFVTGMVGEMSEQMIDEQMRAIAND